MITYFLIFVVASLAAGLLIQNYEGLTFKIEFAGYCVEASTTFAVFVLSALVLLLAITLRLFLAYAFCVYRIKCRSFMRRYEVLGKGYAFLNFGTARDVQQVIDSMNTLQDLDSDSLALLEACAWFKLGQYEMSERPFQHLRGSKLLNEGLGLWLLESLQQKEKSKDCRLRVLKRLCGVFDGVPYAVIFRLEIARMLGDWDVVLTEVKFASKRGIKVPYEYERIEEIARSMLASACYQRGEYREGLRFVEKVTGMHATILKARFYEKLGNLSRALEVLEACYKEAPHPEVVAAYLEVASDREVAMERLSNFQPDHHVSLLLTAKRHFDARQYNAAEQYVKRALLQYRYVAFYCMMLDVMACIGNVDEIVHWLEKMKKDALPDVRWECTKCHKVLPEWQHECPACSAFDAVQWVE
ncbi:MAG: hypothetical protein ACTJLL_02330 [Anaplasma sp.]